MEQYRGRRAASAGARRTRPPLRRRRPDERLHRHARLLRLASRRDRVLVPVSAFGLVVLSRGRRRRRSSLFPTTEPRSGVDGVDAPNPALVAMYGPISSLGIDSIATFKSVLLGAVFLALLAYVVVRRHTRTEEEAGRLELLGAGVVGRRARAGRRRAARQSSPCCSPCVLTVVCRSPSVSTRPVRSPSESLGSTMGLTWVGVTAVAAQLTETAAARPPGRSAPWPSCSSCAPSGDTAEAGSPLTFLSWLSPLGWGDKVSPFGANRSGRCCWASRSTALLVVAAFALLERRDLGAGVLPPRPGHGRSPMRTVEALTAYLARGTLIGWVVTAIVLGTVLGSIAGSVQTFIDSPQIADMLRKWAAEPARSSTSSSPRSCTSRRSAVAAMGISLVTRLRSEETSLRGESVLATSVTRLRWALSHVGVAVLATTLVMVLVGIAAGLADSQRTGDAAGSIGRLIGASIVTLPAIWVCVGHRPRSSSDSCHGTPGWSGPSSSGSCCSGSSGRSLGLPEWVAEPVALRPRARACRAATLVMTPLITLTAVAAGLGARRDRCPAAARLPDDLTLLPSSSAHSTLTGACGRSVSAEASPAAYGIVVCR